MGGSTGHCHALSGMREPCECVLQGAPIHNCRFLNRALVNKRANKNVKHSQRKSAQYLKRKLGEPNREHRTKTSNPLHTASLVKVIPALRPSGSK